MLIHNNVHPEPEPELNVLLEKSACRCLDQLPANSAPACNIGPAT